MIAYWTVNGKSKSPRACHQCSHQNCIFFLGVCLWSLSIHLCTVRRECLPNRVGCVRTWLSQLLPPNVESDRFHLPFPSPALASTLKLISGTVSYLSCDVSVRQGSSRTVCFIVAVLQCLVTYRILRAFQKGYLMNSFWLPLMLSTLP